MKTIYLLLWLMFWNVCPLFIYQMFFTPHYLAYVPPVETWKTFAVGLVGSFIGLASGAALVILFPDKEVKQNGRA